MEFGRSTTGPLESHVRDIDHIRYGEAVRDLFESKGLNPATMTTDQAKAFIAEIKASSNPRIGGYLSGLRPRVPTVTNVMRGLGPAAIGIGLIPLAVDPNYTWRDYGGDVLCGIAFGCGAAR